MNALFLTVALKKKTKQMSNSEKEKDKCLLTIEIVPLPNEELLHKLPTLRGGRVLLPRDLEQIKETGNIKEIN